MKLKKILLIVAIVLICLIIAGFFYFKSLNNSVITAERGEIPFKVEKGKAAKTIIKELKDKNLIKSTTYAYIYVRQQDLNLKAGSYKLKAKMTTQEIMLALTKGTQATKKLTIPEGLSLKKMAKHFEANKLAKYDDFMKLVTDKAFLKKNGITAQSAEGFLYPETYFFGEEDSLEMMLSLMIKTFFEKTAKIKNFPKDFDEIYKKIILASIIEREYQIENEAYLISGVFTNRLKINMGLQSCATVEYIITEIQGKKHPKRLFYEDLEIDSPYNTYMYAGLPPSPICSSGFTAIDAACNPDETDYFYFRLIDPNTGKHAFSKTIEEHNRAKNKFLLRNR